MKDNTKRFISSLLCFSLGSVGDGINFTILPLMAISFFKTPEAVALVITARTLPGLLFSIPAGLISDLYSRKKILLCVNFVRFLFISLLAFYIIIKGNMDINLMLLFAFFIGIFEVTFDNCFLATIPQIAANMNLVRANTLFKSSEMVCGLLFGGVIGAIAYTISVGTALFINAFFYLISVVMMVAISPFNNITDVKMPSKGIMSQLKRGLSILVHFPEISVLILIGCITNLVYYAIASTLIIYIKGSLNFGNIQFSFINNAPGIGLFLGSLLIVLQTDRFKARIYYPLGLIAFSITLFALNHVTNFLSLFFVFLSMGVSWSITSVVATVAIQSYTPLPDQGKVRGIARFLTAGSIPLGSYLGGILLNYSSFQVMYNQLALISLTMIVIYTLFSMKSPIKLIRTKNHELFY